MEFDKFIIVNAYVPNAGLALDKLEYRSWYWDYHFYEYMATIKKKGKAVILAGDLNVVGSMKDIHKTNPSTKAVPGMTTLEIKNFKTF